MTADFLLFAPLVPQTKGRFWRHTKLLPTCQPLPAGLFIMLVSTKQLQTIPLPSGPARIRPPKPPADSRVPSTDSAAMADFKDYMSKSPEQRLFGCRQTSCFALISL
ncbi:hypothetical protein EI534_21165 [Pseudomonas frederiksbergensis]|nr:hypothetical protein [Pseudomonas frederiksbergensis]